MIVHNNNIGRRLPELQTLILCSGWFYKIFRIWVALSKTAVMYFSGYCKIITWFLFVGILRDRIERCEEHWLSSTFCLSSSSNESFVQNRFHVVRTTPVYYEFLPVVWNCDVPHQFCWDHVSSLGLLHYSNLILLLSSWISSSQPLCEQFCSILNELNPNALHHKSLILLDRNFSEFSSEFRDRCSKRSMESFVSRNTFPFSLLDGTCAFRVLLLHNMRFLGASFLSAKLFQRRRTRFFLFNCSFCDQLAAGVIKFRLWNRCFIHVTIHSSAYQDPGISFWITWRRNFMGFARYPIIFLICFAVLLHSGPVASSMSSASFRSLALVSKNFLLESVPGIWARVRHLFPNARANTAWLDLHIPRAFRVSHVSRREIARHVVRHQGNRSRLRHYQIQHLVNFLPKFPAVLFST